MVHTFQNVVSGFTPPRAALAAARAIGAVSMLTWVPKQGLEPINRGDHDADLRAYARAIRTAADELGSATPPAAVAAPGRSLVALYTHTAGALDALATEFDGDQDPVALAASAQKLSSEIQRLASREQQLRGAIERALAAATTPATTP